MAAASLDSAKARLERALDRLEGAAERVIAVSGGEGARMLAGELERLRAERDHLSARFVELEKKYADLRAVTETVSSRLDETIGRVRDIIRG